MFALAAAVRAQTVAGMETVDAPIEAKVKPAAAIAGMRVKIIGTTEFDGKSYDLKITITPPGAAPIPVAGKISNTDKFEIAFDQTAAPGKYTVKIVAPVELPFQNASFIITRSMRDNPEFTVETDETGKIRTIQKIFTRDHKSEKDGFEAAFRLNVKMCKPTCINNQVFEQ